VDAFIISDKLIVEDVEYGDQHPTLKNIEREIRREMDASPCLKGRTKGSGRFGFKIFGSKALPGFRREGAVLL
jgi:hypothetical protein